METLFRKVLVSERLPSDTLNSHFTNKGELHLIGGKWKQWWQGDQFIETNDVEWWIEPIQLPSDEEILQKILTKQDKDQTQFMRGIDYILGLINNKK